MKRLFTYSRFFVLISTSFFFFLTNIGYGQSDRPCAAPFFPVGNCASTIPFVLTGSSFQAGDAPIPLACNLPYSVDVWARFVAPSSNFTLSYITRTFGFSGASENPDQINVLFYQESPDCNNLLNPIGCQVSCALAQVCISIDGMEGAAVARRFVGLVPGSIYYMRVLWNPASNPAPDSVRISLADFSCSSCEPCGGLDGVLDNQSIQLNGQAFEAHVALSWEIEGARKDGFTIQKSRNLMDWEDLSIPYSFDGKGWSANDNQVTSGDRFYYRIQQLQENGATRNSEVIEVQVGSQDWLKDVQISNEVLLLQLGLEADAKLKIYDLQGRLLCEKYLDHNVSQVSIPISQLSNGLLMLSLTGSVQAGSKLVRVWN